MRSAFALACLLSWYWLSPAHAQVGSVLLLPARGDERLPAQRDAAQEALSAALSSQGSQVLSHAEALAQMPEGSAACAAVDCAPSMLRALSVKLAAACAVWLSPDAPEGTVFVTLVDDTGARFPGAHSVHAGDLAIATRAALADARSLQMLGPGPWVRIHGQPEGAKVFIDGHLAGTLPHRAAMTAGRYALRVEADGHIADEQDLDVPLNAGRVVDVEVALIEGQELPAPLTSEIAPSHHSTERRAQVGDYVLGGALAVGGLLLMTIDPVPAAAKHGECADASCREVYNFGTRTTLELITGAALVASGAVVAFVWMPFSVQVNAGTDASVQLSTRF